MVDVLYNYEVEKIVMYIGGLDAQLRATLGSTIAGISYDGSLLLLHYAVPQNEADTATADGIISGHNSLVVNATQSIIEANDVNETVITSGGLATFDYTVSRDGVVLLSGAVNDGSLEFSTDTAGVYLIELINGTATGYVQVEAQ